MAIKLPRHMVSKPWGRTELPAMFGNPSGERIGEVWFSGAEDLPLLVKYIFTSERLSIQVHPDDEQAVARGLPRGKSECWLILDAEPDATIGLGLKKAVSKDELRSAALDGSIEELLDWKQVRAGDFFYVPAGTVHAIGAGISLVEFQQNSDATYRLYDYGRPRELHLDDGIAVSDPGPYPRELLRDVADQPRTLVDGPIFSLTYVVGDSPQSAQAASRWLLPISGKVLADGQEAGPGECLFLEAGEEFILKDARVLVGSDI